MITKRGRFTKAVIEENTVTLFSLCGIKEALALYLPSGKHLPEIARKQNYVYVMPYYQPLTAKSKTAWKQYKQLCGLKSKYSNELRKGYRQQYTGDVLCELCSELSNFPELQEAFDTLLSVASNFASDLVPDFSKSNFSVDSEGNLVLRDIFCSYHQLLDDSFRYSERKFNKYNS